MYNADNFINSVRNDPFDFSPEKIRSIAGKDEWLYNCALNTYEYMTQMEAVTSYPLDVILPMTGWCNADCVFCRYCSNEKYFLSPEELDDFEVLLRFVKNFGFSSYGEPLVHPQFGQFAQNVKSKIDPRATTYLVTNGILLHKHLDNVKRYCNSVSISLNAASSAVHQEVMRIRYDAFYDIMDAISDLVRYRDYYNAKFLIQMSFVVIKHNLHEIPSFIKLAQRLRVDKIYFNTLNLSHSEDFTASTRVNEEEYMDLHPINHPDFDRLYEEANYAINQAKVEIQVAPEGWKTVSIYNDANTVGPNLDGSKSIHCSYLYQRLMMTDLGRTIRTCCFLENPPGFRKEAYVGSDSFLKQWNTDGFRKMRKMFSRTTLPKVCQMCSAYEKNIFR